MTDGIPIFDIDTHYTEQPDLWTSRAPTKYRDMVLNVREQDNGHQAWFVADQFVTMTGPGVVDADMEKRYGVITLPRYEEMARAGTFAADRVRMMDGMGVGTQLIYPNVIGFGGQALMKVTDDPELRLWHVQAYNDAILEMQQESRGRLLPQAALPLWDLDASLKELERTRKMGLTGITMSHSPHDFGQPPLADPAWDRFFATCQDLCLPINFHVGSGSFEGDLSKWWGSERTVANSRGELNSPMSIYGSLMIVMGNSHDIANLIMTGLLEKYPRLKFVSVESGAGWVPFAIQGLEYLWKELMNGSYRSRFKREPKEMFMDQIYCSYWFEDRKCVDLFIAEFGPDNLMFETDFPHPTSLYPGADVKRKVEETLGHHSREVQEKILYRNAESVYGVKVQQPAVVPA